MLIRREKVVEAGDGTRLYARETRGPDAEGTPIVCLNGIGVSTIFWKYLEEHFPPSRPVICWDYRGHGNSEFPRDLDDLTIEATADDTARVLDAFGYDRAVAVGHSMGCQVGYTFAHRHKDRTVALVTMLGAVGRPVHTFLDRETPSLMAFMLFHKVATKIPGPLQRGQARMLTGRTGRKIASRLARLSGLVHPTQMPQIDLEAYLDHFGHFSPLVFFRMAENMATHTAEPFLPSMPPTLVVAGERDLFTPLHLSEEAVDRMPNARLVVLREGSHAGVVEQPEVIHREIDAFFDEHGVDDQAPAVSADAQVA